MLFKILIFFIPKVELNSEHEHFWFEYESSDHPDIQTSLAGFNLHHLLSELVPVSSVLDAVELLVVHVIITAVTPDWQVTEAEGHHVIWENNSSLFYIWVETQWDFLMGIF